MGATKDLHIRMQDEFFNTIHRAEEGEINHLEALIQLRSEKKQLETSLEIIKEYEANCLDQIATEAGKYPEGYNGHKITIVPGRRSFVFKNIDEVLRLEVEKKAVEEKYKSAYDGYQKGIIQTTKISEAPDSPLGWIDEYGEVKPFPEVNFSKSFVKVEALKK